MQESQKHPGTCLRRRDPDAFTLGSGAKPYAFSLPVPADPVLSHLLKRQLAARLGEDGVVEGMNATADSFYSSQVGWLAALGATLKTRQAGLACMNVCCASSGNFP